MQGNRGVNEGTPTIRKSSISEMRSKLGYLPLQSLADHACVPLADPKRHADAFYNGLRLVAIDGSNFEVSDEADNIKAFGYPSSRTGHAGYPQAQCAVLIECATHAILAAHIDAYRISEWAVCQPLWAHLKSGMLCLADRGFSGYNHWQAATATGADLLWRCPVNRRLPGIKALGDDSYLSVIYPPEAASVKQRLATERGITVRVIDYTLLYTHGKHGPEASRPPTLYRLLTTLPDE